MEANPFESDATPPGASATSGRAEFDFAQIHRRIGEFLSKQLFFIGAYPKSGTTWLQAMLNAHPNVACRGEGHLWNAFAPLLAQDLRAHNKVLNRKNRTVFKEFASFPTFEKAELQYLLGASALLLMLKFDDVRTLHAVGEKTPNNLSHFGQIRAVFPGAKFIHIVRDGRDCAVSAWFHNLRIAPEQLQQRHGTIDRFVVDAATSWVACVQHGLRFAAQHRADCKIIRYEDLIDRPHVVMQLLLSFLGVDASAAAVDQCVCAGSFETMTGGRKAGIEDRSSFLRQGQPGNWRQHISPEVEQMFLATAGRAMKALGYQT